MTVMSRFARAFCLAWLCICGVSARSQVLARPGWAGSGVHNDPWWKHAVFYRISPELYQATGDSSHGDLAGLMTRLGYIHSLGVDAIVLTPPFAAEGVSDVALMASRVHLRVVVALTAADPARARFWLDQGVAGLLVDMPALGADPAGSLRALRKLVDSVPGDRVLLGPPVYLPANEAPQLTFAVAITASAGVSASALRRDLAPMCDASAHSSMNPVMELRGWNQPATASSSAGEAEVVSRTLAAMAMLSRGAVIFDAGRELGLASANGAPLTMQWTPVNVTQPPAPTPPPTPAKPAVEVYGTYTPYVPPPKLKLPKPIAPAVVVAENPPPADPNTLPGFTEGKLDGPQALNGATANVGLEEDDENSTLNFFRHLIALRNSNPALRDGAQTLVDEDSAQTLAWLRSAPANARSAGSVLVAANLSGQSAVLSGAGTGPLRPLLTAGAQASTLASPGVLPAWELMVAQVSGAGGSSRSKSHTRHRRR